MHSNQYEFDELELVVPYGWFPKFDAIGPLRLFCLFDGSFESSCCWLSLIGTSLKDQIGAVVENLRTAKLIVQEEFQVKLHLLSSGFWCFRNQTRSSTHTLVPRTISVGLWIFWLLRDQRVRIRQSGCSVQILRRIPKKKTIECEKGRKGSMQVRRHDDDNDERNQPHQHTHIRTTALTEIAVVAPPSPSPSVLYYCSPLVDPRLSIPDNDNDKYCWLHQQDQVQSTQRD